MQENKNNSLQYDDEEGIDMLALIKSLWDGRKTVIITTCIFIGLGLVAALTMKRTYEVNTVMVPQMSSKSSSSLSSLASLAGFDLGTSSSGAELSPLIYPQIVNSVPFRKELMYTPLHFADVDTAVSMFTYAKDYTKTTVMGSIMKYTIGLPGTILTAIRGEQPDMVLPGADEADAGDVKPLVLSNDEVKVLKKVGESVSLMVDKKEGYITLSVKGNDPVMAAELAIKAQQLLQEEVTRFRVEKSQTELDYIQARYNEIKKEAEAYQDQLALVTDRSQNMTGTRDRIERDRIQAKYNVANSIYGEMAKQLEQAKMQVKKDTPVFTVIQPVTVPTQPSNSRSKTLIVWTFLGFVLGCGIVLAKGYLPKLMEQFKNETN